MYSSALDMVTIGGAKRQDLAICARLAVLREVMTC